MAGPKVSVIIPVYNCSGTLNRAIDSVVGQSLGLGRIEIIAVDDGSTDGSGAELDRLAGRYPQLAVVHQPNSGGPGVPRNRGIERASGEYVFFLDADDYLGDEALERMCAIADENDTDVVIGKYVPVKRSRLGRLRTIVRTTVRDMSPNFYGGLKALKMFRRELLLRHRIRFPEGVPVGEDKLFTAHAYLHARGISVVGDYDCYYWVERDDGTSVTQQGGDNESYLAAVGRPLIDLVVSHTEPGQTRDRLLVRNFTSDIFSSLLSRSYLRGGDEEKRQTEDTVAEIAARWLTPATAAMMPPSYRLLAHCLRRGLRDELRELVRYHHSGRRPPTVVEGDRAFVAYPFFRDPARSVPDSCYDATDTVRLVRRLTGLAWHDGRLVVRGEAFVEGADTSQQRVALLLRSKRLPGVEHRVTTTPEPTPRLTEAYSEKYGSADYGRAGFCAEIDPATVATGGPLPPGLWDAHVEVRIGGLVKQARLGEDKDDSVVAPGSRSAPAGGSGRSVITPRFNRKYGNLTLDVR
jgi:glycosyltransferase involved in cell wall biosynthesis